MTNENMNAIQQNAAAGIQVGTVWTGGTQGAADPAGLGTSPLTVKIGFADTVETDAFVTELKTLVTLYTELTDPEQIKGLAESLGFSEEFFAGRENLSIEIQRSEAGVSLFIRPQEGQRDDVAVSLAGKIFGSLENIQKFQTFCVANEIKPQEDRS